MPRDLFGDVTDPSIKIGNRKWYTVPLSLAAHVAVIVPLVLVPLLAADVIPLPHDTGVFVAAPALPREPPPPPPAKVPTNIKPQSNRDAAPIEAPSEIKPEPPHGFELPTTNVVDDGVPGANVVTGDPPPPPPPPHRDKHRCASATAYACR